MQRSVNGRLGDCLQLSSGPISAEGVLVLESLISPGMKGPVRSDLEFGLYSMPSHFQNTVRKHTSVPFYIVECTVDPSSGRKVEMVGLLLLLLKRNKITLKSKKVQFIKEKQTNTEEHVFYMIAFNSSNS